MVFPRYTFGATNTFPDGYLPKISDSREYICLKSQPIIYKAVLLIISCHTSDVQTHQWRTGMPDFQAAASDGSVYTFPTNRFK